MLLVLVAFLLAKAHPSGEGWGEKQETWGHKRANPWDPGRTRVLGESVFNLFLTFLLVMRAQWEMSCLVFSSIIARVLPGSPLR